MEDFQKENTSLQPEVAINNSEIFITGRSMMEDASAFYADLVKWAKGTSDAITITFDLFYFNSSSAKQILKLLLILEEQNKDSKVIWFYPKGNTVLQKRGKEFEVMVDLAFEYKTK